MREINETNFLEKLTDDFGVWQHTKKGKIRKDMGYALDDAARALIVYLLYKDHKNASVCLRYIEKSYRNGLFVGFFNDKRESIIYPSSHDSLGLTMWALSFAQKEGFEVSRCQKILSMVDYKVVLKDKHLRAVAYLLISMCHLEKKEESEAFLKIIIDKYNSFNGLSWFEDSLFYANAVMPLSLIMYLEYFHLKSEEIDHIILTAISTLEKEMRIGVIPAPVGNRKWQKIGDMTKDIYGQQPIDAGFMVLLHVEAFKHFGDPLYSAKAEEWMNWFYGNNIWKAPLVTKENACGDGLDVNGVSEDMGAESTILYLWAKHSYESILN